MRNTSIFVCALCLAMPAAATKGQASGTPAEAVARFQRDLAANHLQSIAPMFAPEAEAVMAGNQLGTVPFAGTYTGQDRIDALLRALASNLHFEEVTFQYMVSSGNQIVSHFDITATVVSTGKTCRLEWAFVWQFAENNQVTALDVFYDTYGLWLAFQPGGEQLVTDLRPSPEDFAVRAVPYDATAVVWDAYGRFFGGDVEAVLPFFTDASQWVIKGSPDVLWAGSYRGTEGFRQFLYNMLVTGHAAYVPPWPMVHWVLAEGNRAEAYLMEPQMNPGTGEVALTRILHSFAIDETQRLIQMDSFNDSFELYHVFARPPASGGGDAVPK